MMHRGLAMANLSAVGLAIIAVAGCGGGESARLVPQSIAADAPQKAMDLYDANHDGFLDDSELEKVPGLAAAKKEVDTNHDGKISVDEIAARINAWRESKLGRNVLTCVVTRHHKPLPGATVTLTPEGFLGDQLTSGSGITDATGRAFIAATANPPGLSPGFYRVQITKEGENIPAKYNTETVLGQEVARDAAGLNSDEGGPHFDLDYGPKK
jgi:hypothetical protein